MGHNNASLSHPPPLPSRTLLFHLTHTHTHPCHKPPYHKSSLKPFSLSKPHKFTAHYPNPNFSPSGWNYHKKFPSPSFGKLRCNFTLLYKHRKIFSKLGLEEETLGLVFLNDMSSSFFYVKGNFLYIFKVSFHQCCFLTHAINNNKY